METANSGGSSTTSGQSSRHSTRGFASMNSERQREIARKGGRAAHAKGTAHEFTADEARAAGQKGGQRVSSNREHMSRIGRIGGKKSAGRRSQDGKAADGTNSPDQGGDAGSSQPGQDAKGRAD
jgi:general stress protein YciG